MNIQNEINRTAKNLGMVPGSEKRFDFDGLKFNPREDLAHLGQEYFIIDVVTLKEGKSGNTRLRIQGRVKYIAHENEIWRQIPLNELNPDSILEILNIISK